MDLSIPGSDLTSPLSTAFTSVFSDNVQDLIGAGTLQVKPSSIITVNSIADVADKSVGVTTLREAINQANADQRRKPRVKSGRADIGAFESDFV